MLRCHVKSQSEIKFSNETFTHQFSARVKWTSMWLVYWSTWRLVGTTDTERRSQNSYTAPGNGVVNHGAPIAGIGVFANRAPGNKCKQNASTIFVWHAAFQVWLSSSQTTVRMHLMNHGYFDCRKTLNTPNWSPMPGWRWPRFWDLWSIPVVSTYHKRYIRV